MPYNVVANSFYTKKLCSGLSSCEVRIPVYENGHFAFLCPFGCLVATYNVHLRLIGKHVVDFFR